MSMKKRMVAMVMAVMMAATMIGCGKSDDKQTVSVETPAGQTVADNNKVPGEKEVKTLTQILDENEYTIWYDINAVDKNYCPEIMIFYNDGTYTYLGIGNEGNKKLGEYAQMSDEEIKTYVEEKVKEVKENSSAEQNSYDRGHYYISVWTDASGNKVQKEQVSLRKPDGSGDTTLELNGVVGAQPVYESYYGGYLKENGGKMWITRIDSNIRFEYDAIGTEGVTIDRYADEIVNYKDDSAAATAY